MFLKVLSGLLLVGTCLTLPNVPVTLDDDSIAILSDLQSDHYSKVQGALDAIEFLTSKLYFIDDDLRKHAEIYFNQLAYDELEQLAPVLESCGDDDGCIACFDSEDQLTVVAINITASLVAYFDKQKVEFNSTIADIKANLQDSALLTTTVYEKYKDSSSFAADARSYYERIQKAIIYENDLMNTTVQTTSSILIKHSIDSTIQATNDLETIFNDIVECAEQALNH